MADALMEIGKGLGGVLLEIYKALAKALPKFLSLAFWILVALFVVPCVLVANHWYPKWVEWGEKL